MCRAESEFFRFNGAASLLYRSTCVVHELLSGSQVLVNGLVVDDAALDVSKPVLGPIQSR
ncbi:hypothetical protein PCAR4_250048 [Paraburkholderia caribensis]|nr:hypothetical protein PCAR4_250048 [Paraburkholderia caribensis]